MRNSRWVRLLAYVTGSVNQEPLRRNEYLRAENLSTRSKKTPGYRVLGNKSVRRSAASSPEYIRGAARAELASIGRDTILLYISSDSVSAHLSQLQVRSHDDAPNNASELSDLWSAYAPIDLIRVEIVAKVPSRFNKRFF